MKGPFARSTTDRFIGGVCGGLSDMFGIQSWAIRTIFFVLLICFGTGIGLYLILWLIMPDGATGKRGYESLLGWGQAHFGK
ncbi:MAG: PspC domain-containing protein [Propionibacteriaceae bacterium]|jgi:phage shock protein PspC (stress-responsive transcriptional regulator)|nr:PspC domain-containing protein [Propionibacteriaceae bacterium]